MGVCVCSGEGGAEIHPHIAERQTAERMMPVLRLHEHEIRMVVRGCGRYYPRFYKQSLKIFVFSNLLLCFCNSVMYCSLDHLCSLSLSWSLLSRGGWCDFKWIVLKSQLTNFHSIAWIIANKAKWTFGKDDRNWEREKERHWLTPTQILNKLLHLTGSVWYSRLYSSWQLLKMYS